MSTTREQQWRARWYSLADTVRDIRFWRFYDGGNTDDWAPEIAAAVEALETAMEAIRPQLPPSVEEYVNKAEGLGLSRTGASTITARMAARRIALHGEPRE